MSNLLHSLKYSFVCFVMYSVVLQVHLQLSSESGGAIFSLWIWSKFNSYSSAYVLFGTYHRYFLLWTHCGGSYGSTY